MKRIATFAFVLAALVTSPTQAKAAGPCETEQHQAFNFWLGKWRVTKQDGSLAGENHIQAEYGGCVIHERYTTEKGYKGESLNIYDKARGVWHQTWVDNGGLLLTLEGEFKDGAMVLSGKTKGKDDQMVNHKITWTANSDGTVRQHWQTSEDGNSWETAFDGLYTKIAE